jgi:hypothetical protein
VLVYLAQRRRLAGLTVGLGVLWLAAGCTQGAGISRAGPGAPPAADAAETRDAGFTFAPPDGLGVVSTGPGGCLSRPDEDHDHDGYSVEQGDCNDCDRQVNPGAYDVAGNGIDEDCSGQPDDEPAGCDVARELREDGVDPVQAARSLGICRMAAADAQGKDRTWGLLRASYVFPDGNATGIAGETARCGHAGEPPNSLSHGILSQFGTRVKPRQGTTFLVLSSGVARSGQVFAPMSLRPSPNGAQMCTSSPPPMGFPVSDYSTCGDLRMFPGSAEANDAIALELVIRVPTNAGALSFDFDFYTFEYSDYVCSFFNDAFVALLYSKAPGIPANHNIALDSQGNPVSVNNGFVEVCDPYTYDGNKGGVPFTRAFPCKLGTAELAGTGFEQRAATGWLQTHANVVPGEELTLRFAIWDAGDEFLDSTVLLDDFRWEVTPGTTVTVRPPPIQ